MNLLTSQSVSLTWRCFSAPLSGPWHILLSGLLLACLACMLKYLAKYTHILRTDRISTNQLFFSFFFTFLSTIMNCTHGR